MAERIIITLTQTGLLRTLSKMVPVMRARRDITPSSGDVGLAGAFAKHLDQGGFTVSRAIDPQYLDLITRELGRDGFTHG